MAKKSQGDRGFVRHTWTNMLIASLAIDKMSREMLLSF